VLCKSKYAVVGEFQVVDQSKQYRTLVGREKVVVSNAGTTQSTVYGTRERTL